MIKIQKDKNEFFIILSKEEAANIFSSVDNIKHKAILMPVYYAGLRAGKVVRLKTEDIDSKRMLIHIISPKGRKGSGTDLRYIKELLDYKDNKTTEIYTHVSTQSPGKIKSPLDSIKLKEGGC